MRSGDSLNRSMRRLSILLFFALSAALPAQQKPAAMVQLPPKPLLPMSFAGWTAVSAPMETTTAAQTQSLFSVDAAFLTELGFRRAARATYNEGSRAIELTAVQFEDATGAYGFFPGFGHGEQPVEITAVSPEIGYKGEQAYARLRSGDTTVYAAFDGPLPPHFEDDLKVLAKTLPIPFGSKGTTPQLSKYLPKEGLDRESFFNVFYSIGPEGYAQLNLIPVELIDFSRDAETIAGNCKFHGHFAALLLIEYPTPQMAIERANAIQTWLKSGNAPKISQPDGNTGSPASSVSRSGPIVVLATGYFSQKDADALAGEVHYESSITWDKPEGYVSDAWRAAHLYLGIFALAGILCAASVILGLFFGGARAITRVMRGKSASAVQDAEFISLDLGHGGDYKPDEKN